MELKDIQIALSEFETNDFNINNSITRVLRIAQLRIDVEELLFCKLIKIHMTSENNKVVYEEVKKIAIRKGITEEQFKGIYQNLINIILEVRKWNWFDAKSNKMLNKIIVSSASEMILELKHNQDILENNKIPDGMATLDVYYANENKKKMDNLLNNRIINYKTILNKMRDYLVDYLLRIESEMLSLREREEVDTKIELELLIVEGKEISDNCLVPGIYRNNIKGIEYVTWIQKCIMFLNKHVSDKEIYSRFKKSAEKANGNSSQYLEEMLGILVALIDYDFSDITHIKTDEKINKIFISHSSEDLGYVKLLVQLLNDIGIKKSGEHIFCSSLSGYDIPYGENIYDYLKKELDKSNIMVLFVLSHNYYQSAPCLNEMGAAWVSAKKYNSIITPNFDFNKVTGAIDPSRISFKLTDEDGLNKFKDKIVEIFELDDVDYKIWESDRKNFVSKATDIAELEASNMNTQVFLEKVKRVNETKIELQLRLINVTDQELEFKFIDIGLVDSNGIELHLSAEEIHLDGFKLYGKENKVMSWIFEINEQYDYNPRRDNSNLTKISFEIY
ncbi:toll/interleukin-1 receptor domain-containing protein [Viridibacillus arvi]|uniref:toll/interleukin-1 receptor domain-containing protein n=1 Tax=Viridibacillus arvi TaxID=263475 RepID=UPI00367D73C4